jgi:hypothetical protein
MLCFSHGIPSNDYNVHAGPRQIITETPTVASFPQRDERNLLAEPICRRSPAESILYPVDAPHMTVAEPLKRQDRLSMQRPDSLQQQPACCGGAYGSSPFGNGPQTEGNSGSLVALQYRINLNGQISNVITSVRRKGDLRHGGFTDSDSRSMQVFSESGVVLCQSPELELGHGLLVWTGIHGDGEW